MSLGKLMGITVGGGVALITLATSDIAQAASFNFSYILENGSILSGMLDGDVQADGDTVVVNSISMPTFNGVAAPNLPFVESGIEYLSGNPGSPVVSFSGSVMDFLACNDSGCSDGFLLDSSGSFFDFPVYSSSLSYGSAFETYNPQRWELTAKNTVPVPEPSSVFGLLALGALGAGTVLKRK